MMTSTGSQIEEAPAAPPAAARVRIHSASVFRSLRQDTVHLTEACGHLRGCTVVGMPVCRDCLRREA